MDRKKAILLGLGIFTIIVVAIGYKLIFFDRADYAEKICIENNYKFAEQISCRQTDCVVKCCNDKDESSCETFPVT